MTDLVVQLLLRTGQFSTDLKTAKGQIQNFEKGVKNVGNTFQQFASGLGVNVSSLMKFGTAAGAVAGIAVAAGKTIKDGIGQNADVMDELSRKTETAKSAWHNFTNAIVNGGAISSLKELKKEAREAYDAFDSWNVANGAINTVLSVSETQYGRLIEKARDVALADVDRLDALNQAAVIMQKEISMQRALANLDKNRSKEALDNALQSKGINPENVSQEQLNKFMQVDENGKYDFDKYLEDYGELTSSQKRNLRKAGGVWALADALHNIERDDKNNGAKILDDYLKNNVLNYGIEKVDYDEQQMKTEIEKIRERIEGGDGKSDTETAKDNALKSIEEYLKETERLYLDEKDKELDIEKDKYEEELEKAKTAQADITQITEAYYKRLEAIEEKYARKPVEILPTISTPNFDEKALTSGTSIPKTIEDYERLIKIYEEARDTMEAGPELDKLNKKIEEFNNKVKEMKGDNGNSVVAESWTDKLSTFSSGISSSVSAVESLSNALKNLREAQENGASGWELFIDTLNVVSTSFNSIIQVIESVNSVMKLMSTTTKAAAATTVAANATEMASTTASATTEVAANTAKAASGAAASQASIPVVGPALAMAAVAALVALLGNLKFANGGIVPGSSFTGDRITASVNSGEMILNGTQQANLWRQINNGGSSRDVTFHISGQDLVGTFNNYNRKNRVTR